MHMNTECPVFNHSRNHNPLTLLLLRLFEHLLHDLLLLNEESADDTVLDAVGASRTAVGALDGLLGAGDGSVLAGAEGGDTGKLGTAVLRSSTHVQGRQNFVTYTALGSSALLLDVEVSELATGSLNHANIVAGGVVRGPSALPIVSLEFQITQQFHYCGFCEPSSAGKRT